MEKSLMYINSFLNIASVQVQCYEVDKRFQSLA